MISKVLCFSALIGIALSYAHGHAPAYSSQHISRHDGPAEVVHVKGHDAHGHGHYVAVDYHILCFSTLLAVVMAQYDHHEEAHSSQHFTKHDGRPEIVHGHHGHHHDYHKAYVIIMMPVMTMYDFRMAVMLDEVLRGVRFPMTMTILCHDHGEEGREAKDL
ncbi:unnamed protein product [Leptosia nina]|uniref:Uncharacterized protein n=1 Tax=Leptosia nina TaxID=320188 RepID=A0AAV1K058_9NEOP